MGIDAVQLNFNPGALAALNWILAIVMFGVALDLRVADFRRVARAPLAPVVGLVCQFLLMPALATGLLMLIRPAPSIALGIILVAACPGGNVSNFFTSLGKGNAALSISMSAISTMASVVMSRPATEAASCRAVRTTLVGSMMPSFTRSTYFSV